MKTLIIATNPHDSLLSFSKTKRYLNFHYWKNKVVVQEDDENMELEKSSKSFSRSTSYSSNSISSSSSKIAIQNCSDVKLAAAAPAPRKKKKLLISVIDNNIAVSKLLLRSALSNLGRARSSLSSSSLGAGLQGTKVVGTLFGHRRGHVHFAFQQDSKPSSSPSPSPSPAFLVELATPTSILVKEMASGLVRIAFECDKKKSDQIQKKPPLLEEPIWRTYCNGKRCGYAIKRECGPDEWKVLNAIGPISMGAGVLPAACPSEKGSDTKGEMMYMRAKFERVVGSKDSEAFYIINPDHHGNNTNIGSAPELSIYLLRL